MCTLTKSSCCHHRIESNDMSRNNNKVVSSPESITADQAIAIIDRVVANKSRRVPIHTAKQMCGRRTIATIFGVVCGAPCIVSSMLLRLASCSPSVETPCDTCLLRCGSLCFADTRRESVVPGATWSMEDLDRVRLYASRIMSDSLSKYDQVVVYDVFDAVKSLAEKGVDNPVEFMLAYPSPTIPAS